MRPASQCQVGNPVTSAELTVSRPKREVGSANARFTLADPMPRLASGSDVVGGKSGRNHPTSRRDPIQIGRMARNAYIPVGWYCGVVQYCTTLWLVQ